MSLSRYSWSLKRIIICADSIRGSLSPLGSCGTLKRSIDLSRSFASGQRVSEVETFTSQRRRYSAMPRPIVYFTEASPPSRAVLLAASAIGVDIEVRNIDLVAGEHRTEEFKKINPEHTVPTLDDDGFVLWDSHAIMCYLSDKYGKDDSLYPKDICRRALINQRLHFESGVIFPRLRFIVFPIFIGTTTEVPQEKMDLMTDAYVHLNNFLERKQWLAGDSYTLADISCVTSISSIKCIAPIDNYSNIKAWLKRCEETLPGYNTINTPGVKKFHGIMMGRLSKGKL